MPLTDGIVGYWRLDEASGIRFDRINGQTLGDNAGVTSGTGKVGTLAASFAAASSQFLNVANSPIHWLGDGSAGTATDIPWTLCAWVKVTSTPTAARAVVGKRGVTGAANTELLLAVDDTLHPYCLAGNGSTYASAVSTSTLTVGTWHFLVAWHDPVADTLNIQVDGGTPTSAAWSGGSFLSTGTFDIGRYQGSSANFWDGLIEQVGYWKRVLTESERAQLWNSGNGYDPTTSTLPITVGLGGYWRLDEASDTRYDQMGRTHLTANGGSVSSSNTPGTLPGPSCNFVRASSQYLNATENGWVDTGVNTPWTISFWVRVEQIWQMVFTGKSNSMSTVIRNVYTVSCNTSGVVSARIGNGVTSAMATWGSALTTGQWYHIFAYHDQFRGVLGLSINGGTPVETAWTDGTYNNSYPFGIGNCGTQVSNYHTDGQIAHFGFWRRALSLADRDTLYNSGNGYDPTAVGGGGVTEAASAAIDSILSTSATAVRTRGVSATVAAAVSASSSASRTRRVSASSAATFSATSSASRTRRVSASASATLFASIAAIGTTPAFATISAESTIVTTGRRTRQVDATIAALLTAAPSTVAGRAASATLLAHLSIAAVPSVARAPIVATGKLGTGFNASKPTESDFVRHPSRPALAAEIRHIRNRIKSFFGVVFDLTADAVKDNVVPLSSWVEHPAKPSSGTQYYTSVTVDERGVVVGGSVAPVINNSRTFRARFSSDGAWTEGPDGLNTDPAPPITLWPQGIPSADMLKPYVQEYLFVVPAGVNHVRALLISAGSPTEDGPTFSGRMTVVPGELLRIYVGQIPGGACVLASSDRTRYLTSEGYTMNTVTPTSGPNDRAGFQLLTRSPYRPYGGRNPLGIVLNSGLVVLEWYA